MHNRKVTLVPERLERSQRRMQSEKAVKVEDIFLRDVDAGPHRVISAFTMRHDDIQAVSGTALKDHDQPLGARSGLGCTKCRTRQETRDGSGANNSQSAIAKKNATCDGHGKPRRRCQFSAFSLRMSLIADG
jgi:hypothetical protein